MVLSSSNISIFADCLAPIEAASFFEVFYRKKDTADSGKQLLNKLSDTHHNSDMKPFMEIIENHGSFGVF